ncbi:MAG: tetratricopeptide repeat protein [Candidatus Thorarchaeota archaeon]
MKKYSNEVYRRFIEAKHLFDSGKTAEAEKRLRKLLKDYPDFANGWWLLGFMMTGRGRIEDKIEMFQKAVELEPENAMFLESLGVDLIHLGRFRESGEALEKAFRIDPETKGTAIGTLQQAVKSGNPHVYYHYGLGQALRLAGEPKIAMPHLKRAYELNIHFALYEEAGNKEDGVRIAREIVEIDKENSGAWLIVGLGHVDAKEWRQAEDAFRRAIEIDHEYAHAWLGLATALINQGKKDEAFEAKAMADKYNWNVEGRIR